MKLAGTLAVAVVAVIGCGGAKPGAAVSPGGAGEGVHQTPPRNLEPAALLAPAPDEADVLLHLSVARTHPLGMRLDPFVLAWPEWGKTLRRLSTHPVTDIDWLEVAGPRDSAKQRLVARCKPDDAVIDARLKASSDGTLRVVLRPQPHLVTGLPPDGVETVSERLRGTVVVDPTSPADEIVRALFPHPHGFLPMVPEEAQSALFRVLARPGGGAQAELDLSCNDAAAADKVAGAIREQANRYNGIMVRALTHDLLSGLSVNAEGTHVKASLPASRPQLDAIAALAAGILPAEPAP